jgi:ATP adenylyltransferase
MSDAQSRHVDIDNARLDEQRQVMQEIIDADHCPFCRENLDKYHKQEILKEGEFWLVTKNQWPYDFTKVHLLLIYKQHATDLSELDPESGKELLELLQWAQKEYKIPGGGWAMRFGDTDHSAGTVAHIHVQFIMPDLEHPEFKPVRIKIGKSK